MITYSQDELAYLREIANLQPLVINARKMFQESNELIIKNIADEAVKAQGRIEELTTKIEQLNKQTVDAAKKELEEWKKTSDAIGNGISDALIKGLSSGQEAAKALKELFVSQFKDLVLQPQIKALITPATDMLGDLMGKNISDNKAIVQEADNLVKVKDNVGDVVGATTGITNTPNATAGTSGVSGVASLAGAAGPWGMAAVAAYAALSQFGKLQDAKTVEMTAKYRQEHQSTGDVLGSADIKSDSLNKTLNSLGATSKDLLSVNHDMYQALLDIKVGISGASAGISRVIGKKGDFSLDVKTGASTSPGSPGSFKEGKLIASSFGFLGNVGSELGTFLDVLGQKISSAIYNKKTKIIDSGVQFGGQSLADLLSGGDLKAQSYAEVETKKKFLGVTISNSAKTKNGDLDSLIVDQFAEVFKSAGSLIKDASKSFGMDFSDLAGKLKIDPSKLSLKGLTGDNLTKEIESFFSSTLDKWAGVLTNGTNVLKEFQKVGEGAFETVIRLASQVNTFSDYAQKLNLNFSLTGVDAIKASQAIGEYSGGFDVLTNNLSAYYKNYFTVEEQNLDITKKMKAEFESLGLVMPKTQQGFKDLVSAQNGATDAGQKNIAILLGIQDAFFNLTKDIKRVQATIEELNRLDAFGGVFSRISSMSDDARTSLIELAGGIESLLKKSQNFVDLYYSDDEKVGMQAKDVLGKLKTAGVSNSEDLKTTQDFRALMDKLTKADLETEAGRKFFNALLDIGPAFSAVAEYLKKNNLTLGAAAQKGPTDDWFANYLAEQKKATEDTTAQLTSNQETTNAELAQINAALTDAKVDDPKTMIEKQELTNTYLASIDDGVRAGSSSVVAAINTAASSISEAVIRSMPIPAPAGRAVTSA